MNSAAVGIGWGLLMAGCASEPEETQPPASDVREVLSESGLYRVSYTPLPDPIPPVDLFAMELRVVDASTGLWQEDIEIVGLEVSMPEHNHGMNVEPLLTDRGEGIWEASPLKFHMTGSWTIVVEMDSDNGMDQAGFEVACCESPG